MRRSIPLTCSRGNEEGGAGPAPPNNRAGKALFGANRASPARAGYAALFENRIT